MLEAKGTHHDTHTVLGSAFAKKLRHLSLELGRGQSRGIDNIGCLLAQWVQKLALAGDILEQGIALTQGMTTARFLITAHQGLVRSI